MLNLDIVCAVPTRPEKYGAGVTKLKIILLGNSGVGKTSLHRKLVGREEVSKFTALCYSTQVHVI